MAVNIVTNFQIISKIRTSAYFKTNLGLIATVEKSGRRKHNEKDAFSIYYNTGYNTIIYGQGNIGDIKFYTDHYIKEPLMAVYFGDTFEEFIFEWDDRLFREKGMDFYIGHILKEVETKYEEKVKNDELKKLEEKPAGNAEALFSNPGEVSFADVQAYLEKKRQERAKGL